ncbi:MAG: SDR family NAD(P)-dependent oxidoreductase [Candidatus Didemnitutus sp.]|nr:SDR family NAD(P)-dependent oxidoreductase [Candidatus Didemnitutus sp.]
MKLQDKVVLVTGASRGIGAAMVRVLVSQGAKVVLSARTAAVEKLAAELRAAGHQAEAVQGDLTDDAHVRTLVQTCRSKFGGLHALINNAGILHPGKLGMMRLADARQMFDVNVLAAINLTQYAIRVFPRGEGGAVVNITSIAGTQGIDGLSAYSASKAALIGFTKAAAKELAPQRIRVNAIAPGFIDTDMARQISPEWFARRVESVRIGRIGQPEDVARCAAFLVSSEADYITGQVIGVDGGMAV